MGHEIFTLALDSSLLGSIPHRVTGELAYSEEYIQIFKCIRELKRLWLKFKRFLIENMTYQMEFLKQEEIFSFFNLLQRTNVDL